jgi:MSHA biogenesis protein MshN
MSLLNDALRKAEGRREPPATSAVYTGEKRAFATPPRKARWPWVALLLTPALVTALAWFAVQAKTPVTADNETHAVLRAAEKKPQSASLDEEPAKTPTTRTAVRLPVAPDASATPNETRPVQKKPAALPVTPVSVASAEQGRELTILNQKRETRARTILTPAQKPNNVAQRSSAENPAPVSAAKPKPEMKAEPEKNLDRQAASTTQATAVNPTAPRSDPVTSDSATPAISTDATEVADDSMTASDSTTAPAQNMVKNTRMTPAIRDQQTAKAIRKALAQGEISEARQQLGRIMATQDAPRSRTRWARHQLVSGQPREALKFLSADLADSDITLRLLRARAQLALGHQGTALQTLQSQVPSAADSPEYVSTLATLLQQAGDYQVAAEHWADLISHDDQHGAWWVGLAITLENQQRFDSAQRAYQQALALTDLAPSLYDFVRQRLQALGS